MVWSRDLQGVAAVTEGEAGGVGEGASPISGRLFWLLARGMVRCMGRGLARGEVAGLVVCREFLRLLMDVIQCLKKQNRDHLHLLDGQGSSGGHGGTFS